MASSRSLVAADFNGIQYDFTDDGWFNATQAADRYGKRLVDWLNQRDTAEYVAALADRIAGTKSGFLEQFNSIKKLPGESAASQARLLALVKKTGLVKTKAGSPENGGGTWLHPKLAVTFARWLDVHFGVWCDMQKARPDMHVGRRLIDERARYRVSRLFGLEADNRRIRRLAFRAPCAALWAWLIRQALKPQADATHQDQQCSQLQEEYNVHGVHRVVKGLVGSADCNAVEPRLYRQPAHRYPSPTAPQWAGEALAGGETTRRTALIQRNRVFFSPEIYAQINDGLREDIRKGVPVSYVAGLLTSRNPSPIRLAANATAPNITLGVRYG